MKSGGRGAKTRPVSPQSVEDRVAWAAILTLVAVLPLITSVAPSSSGTRALTEDPYMVPKVLVLALLFSVIAGAWVMSLLRGERAIRTGAAHYALGAFAVLTVASTAFGLDPAGSLFGASGLMSGTMTWLMCCGVAFLLGQYVSSGERLIQLAWSAVSGCTIVAVIAIMQAAGLDPMRTPFTEATLWMVERGPATLGNPDNTGLALVAPAVLAAALALISKVDRSKAVAAVCAATLAAGAFVTLTRAAWLSIAVGVIVLLVLIPRDREGAARRILWVAGAALGILVVGALIVGPSTLASRFTLIASGVDAFSSGRLTMWSDTLRTIALRPLLGTGADRLALGAYEAQTKVVTEGVNRYVIQDPHSLPLLIAGQFGIPALIAFATFAGMVLIGAWRVVRAESTSENRLIYVGWFAATVGFLTASVLSLFTVFGIFTLFLTLGTLSAPALRPAEKRAWSTATASVLAVALVALGLFGSIQSARASRHVMLATISDSQFHLESAMRLAPWDIRTRVTYQWRKIGAFRPQLTGPDAALARATADGFDTEIKAQIARAPYELLWYRMLVDLHRIPQGTPGYRPEKVVEAIEFGLAKFPNDVEFRQWRSELATAAPDAGP